MKRLCMMLVVFAGIGVGVYAGQTLEFPWMTDAMRQPCGKTALEWWIAENSIRQDEPYKIGTQFDLTKLSAKPTAKGLLVRANCRRRPGITIKPGDRKWNRTTEIVSRRCLNQAQTRFGGEGAFEDWRGLYLVMVVDRRVVAVRTFNHLEILPPDAPANAQNAAIMSMLAEH